MLSLRDYLASEGIGKSEFARRLGRRLRKRVPPQSVHRWTLPAGHVDYSVPEAATVRAILKETGGKVEPNDWFVDARQRRAA